MAPRKTPPQPAAPKAMPDGVTVVQFAKQIKEYMVQVQQRKLNLELQQLANDHEETDMVPGSEPKRDEKGAYEFVDGQPQYPTYAESYGELDAQLARLWGRAKSRKGVPDLIEKLIAAEQAEADVEAKETA